MAAVAPQPDGANAAAGPAASAPSRPAAPPLSVSSLRAYLGLSLSLLVWSIVGLLPLLVNAVPFRITQNPRYAFWHVDMATLESPVIPSLEAAQELHWTDPLFELPSQLFFPVVILSILGADAREWLLLVALLSVTWYPFKWLSGRLWHNAALVWFCTAIVPMAIGVQFCRWRLRAHPECHRVVRTVVGQMGLMMTCFFGGMSLRLFNIESLAAQVLLINVVMPLAKETMLLLARAAVRGWTTDTLVNGGQPRTWALFLWAQLLMSILSRFFIAHVKDPYAMALVVLIQAVQELAMRLTLIQRDRLSVAAWNRLCGWCGGAHPRSTLPLQLKSNPSHSSVERARVDLTKHFLSVWLLGEATSEYAGILIVALDLWIYSGAKLLFPAMYYLQTAGPFLPGLDAAPILVSAALQIASELAVDTICAWHEDRQGCETLASWRSKGRLFPLHLALAAWFALVMSNFCIGGVQDNLSLCCGLDMCFCAPDALGGLLRGGYRASYCAHVYPPHGVPPQLLAGCQPSPDNSSLLICP
jgi:hypothetical protein